jgi:hypothetical protein
LHSHRRSRQARPWAGTPPRTLHRTFAANSSRAKIKLVTHHTTHRTPPHPIPPHPIPSRSIPSHPIPHLATQFRSYGK